MYHKDVYNRSLLITRGAAIGGRVDMSLPF